MSFALWTSTAGFSVFPSLKGGDFRPSEADASARDEDIDSGVDVPIMSSTAATTDPLSYYQVLSTFWAAARTACGTDLRGQSLVNLEVFGPVPHGFVAELRSKLRPAGIEHGLGEAGSGQSTGIDIADADAPVLPHQSRGQPMQEMLATVCDLGVDGTYAGFVTGTLRDCECAFVFTVELWCLDHLARGERRQRFQSEVDTDLASPVLPVFRDFNLQIEVPAAAGILRETATPDGPLDRTAEPEPIAAPEEDHAIAINANRTRRLEGDPVQGFFAAPSRPLMVGIPREGKPLTDRLHGIRVQSEELAATAGECDQIEARGPGPVVPASRFVDFAAVVPDPVHGPRLSQQTSAGGRILDAVSKGQHHGNMVLDRCYKLKTDAKHTAGISTLGLSSAAVAIANVCEATRVDSGSRDAFHGRCRARPNCHVSASVKANHRAPPLRPQQRSFRRGEFR